MIKKGYEEVKLYLKNGVKLYRFKDEITGREMSSIYRGDQECWRTSRENEYQMVADWQSFITVGDIIKLCDNDNYKVLDLENNEVYPRLYETVLSIEALDNTMVINTTTV